MVSKVVESPAAAVAGIADGATVMIGGFGTAGMPAVLIDALIAQGAGSLTVVCNNAGNGETGLAALLKAGRVRKMICSFPRQADSYVFDALYRAGKVELEVVPQGTLVERIRAAGAGIGAFFTPTGYGTMLAEGKESRVIAGKPHVLEYPIHADVALIRARAGRPLGQPRVPQDGPQFRARDGDGRRLHDRGGWRGRRPRRARSREHRDARYLRPSCGGGMNKWSATRWPRASRETSRKAPTSTSVSACRRSSRTILAPTRKFSSTARTACSAWGPRRRQGRRTPISINAGKQPVTLVTGGAYFHHADSFAMIRGGHVDICVLGAFQVSVAGDLANWHTGEPDTIPAVGGAMDLAVGARRVFVMMEHLTKNGDSKIVDRCTYPLTGYDACPGSTRTWPCWT